MVITLQMMTPFNNAFSDGTRDVLQMNANQIRYKDLPQNPDQNPTLDNLCLRIEEAATGNVKAKDANGTMQSYKLEESCKVTSKLPKEVRVYCTLFEAAKKSQAKAYCDARKTSRTAMKGADAALTLDVAAAATCWTEYVALTTTKTTGIAGFLANANAGKICGGAAMAAGMNELYTTINMLTGKDSTTNMSGTIKVNSDGTTEKQKNVFLRYGPIVASLGIGVKGLQAGACLLFNKCVGGKFAKTMKGNSDKNIKMLRHKRDIASSDLETANNNYDAALNEYNKAKTDCDNLEKKLNSTYKEKEEARQKLQTKEKQLSDIKHAKGELIKQSAMTFTVLAATRFITKSSAKKSKANAEAYLESMLSSQPTVGQSNLVAGNGMNAGAGFVGGGSSGVGAGDTSGLTADDPESLLAPRGTPHRDAFDKLANQIPPALLDDATGPSGLPGAIGSVAGGLGADGKQVAAHANESYQKALAALGASEDVFMTAGGGGGGSNKKSGGDGLNLNLTGIMGGENQDAGAQQESEAMQFRGPASNSCQGDIFHAECKSHMNMFQIVSDRYSHQPISKQSSDSF